MSLFKKKFLVFAIVGILCSYAFSYDNEISANVGWGHPFGMSVQYSRYVEETNMIGIGFGLSGAGGKFGISYEHLFSNEGWGAIIGVATSYAMGANNINISVNADTAVYKINSGSSITPRFGIRYRGDRCNVQGNLGYSILLTGGGVEYVSGSEESNVKKFADLIGIGGIEISISIGKDF